MTPQFVMCGSDEFDGVILIGSRAQLTLVSIYIEES